MAFNSSYFVFGGAKSEDKGVQLVSIGEGMITRVLYASRSFKFENSRNSYTPYYFGDEREPFQFTVNIALIDDSTRWTREKIGEITRWLNNGRFTEFYSMDDPEKRYFVQYLSNSERTTNQNGQGYLEITFQNVDCYTRSPIKQEIMWYQTNDDNNLMQFNSIGETQNFPIVTIEKIGDGDLEVTSLNNYRNSFKLTNLLDGEVLTINNKTRILSTNYTHTGISPYARHEGGFLSVHYGLNRIRVSDFCKIKIEYRDLYYSS